MTILTTATNLEDLIDSKPTARGQVLSRFMGLDFLKKKEDIGKEIYSEFSKSMISNVYNSEKLKSDNEDYTSQIEGFEKEISTLQTDLINIQGRIIKGQEYRDGLLKSKHTDIDKEISLISPDAIKGEVLSLNNQKSASQRQLDEIKVIEPSEYYHEDKHDEAKEKYNNLNKS